MNKFLLSFSLLLVVFSLTFISCKQEPADAVPDSLIISYSGGMSGLSLVLDGSNTYVSGVADGGLFIGNIQSGSISWAEGLSSSGSDVIRDLSSTSSGGVSVVGNYGELGYDIYFAIIGADGVLVHAQVLGGTGTDYGYYVAEVSDGFLIYGTTWSVGAGNADLVLTKVDAAGSIQWIKTYGSAEYEFSDGDLLIDSDNSIFISGRTKVDGEADGWILHLDADGNVIWEKRYGGSNWDQINGLAFTGDDNLVAAGVTSSLPGTSVGGWGSFFMKVNKSDGSILWQKYADPKNSSEWAQGITVSGNDFIVTGNTWAYAWEPERKSVMVRSISTVDGTLQWQTVHGVDYKEDDCFDVSVDTNGTIHTIGESPDSLLLLRLDSDGDSAFFVQDGNNSYLDATFTATNTSCTVLTNPSGFGDRGLSLSLMDISGLSIEIVSVP